MIGITVDEFLSMVNKEPFKWVCYCEIIILNNGLILLARPSHTECVINYAMQKESKTRTEIIELLRQDLLSPLEYYISKYQMVAVWYDNLLIGKKSTNSKRLY